MPENILHALGWTVVHSLWQAFIIALLLSAYLLATKASAKHRYIAGLAALGSTLSAAVVTFYILLGQIELSAASEVWAIDGTLLGHYFHESGRSSFQIWFDTNMPFIVTAWLVGMIVFILKLCGGMLYIQRLKTRRLVTVPTAWENQLVKVKNQLGITKNILLKSSGLIKTPMVVGWIKPVVLMPVAAINNLNIQQVEAILAHELAHIARHDYLLNILQSIVEALFYFNPSVWWISSRIRTERENCCDDMAVSICGNSIKYARALVSLQEMQQASPMLALAFSKNKHQLLHRIKRILQSPDKKSNVMEKISATLLLLAAIVMLSMKAKGDLDTPNNFTQIEEIETLAASFGDFEFLSPVVDTIPKGNWHFRHNDENSDVELRMKDGKVVYLEIDGEEIDESEYEKYHEMIEELASATPPPPPPPAPFPPSAPNAPNAVPAPPAPSPSAFPTPPTPPAPPAPVGRTRTITTQKSDKGMTIIIETEPGQEPVEIEIENRRKGNITINGNEIKGLKDGDESVIVEEIKGESGNLFYFDQKNARQFTWPETHEPGALLFKELPEHFAYEKVEELLHNQGDFVFPDDERFHELFDQEKNALFQEKFHENQELRDKELFEYYKNNEFKREELLHRYNEENEQNRSNMERLRQEYFDNNEFLQREWQERAKDIEKSQRYLAEEGRLAEIMELLQEQKQALARSESKLDQEEAQRIAQELNKKAEAMQKLSEETMLRLERDIQRKSRRAQ